MTMINIGLENIFLKEIFRQTLGYNESNIQDEELIESTDTWIGKAQNFNSNVRKSTLKYTYMDNTTRERKKRLIFLISKEEPSDELCLVRVRQSGFFQTEINILENVIPKIEGFVRTKIVPQLIYSSKSKSLIIMEDLTTGGFINKDCKLGFSKQHTLMAIEALAKFHAGSVALNEQGPGILPRFNRYDITEQTHENIFRNIEFCTRAIGEAVRLLPDVRCVQIAPKFDKLATQISHSLLSITKYDVTEFCVLNHGDCWINNIMFRENSCGEPIDVRLIDFQISVWSSPAIDLLFFLSTCPELSIKCQQDDYFLGHYLNILIATMKNLGCRTRPPTMKELKNSMYKRRAFAVKCGLIFYSKLVAGGKCETMEDIIKKGSSNIEIFHHSATTEALMKIVPLMDAEGYLD